MSNNTNNTNNNMNVNTDNLNMNTSNSNNPNINMNRSRAAIRRASETPAQAAVRREKDRLRKAAKRAELKRKHEQTMDQGGDETELTAARARERLRIAQRRANESSEQAVIRREIDRISTAVSRTNAPVEQAQIRRENDRIYTAITRENESAEAAQIRRENDRINTANARENESVEQTQTRRENDRVNTATARANESLDQRQRRQANDNRRRASRALNWKRDLIRLAFQYSPDLRESTLSKLGIGNMNNECRYCKALKWPNEPAGMCCSTGKINVPMIPMPISPLKEYLFGMRPIDKYFRENIRRFNSAFQMTSFGANEIRESGYMPTFKIQGQVYHKIGSLVPHNNRAPSFLQIYFTSSEEQKQIRSTFGFLAHQRSQFNAEIISLLQDMLHDNNHLVQQFKNKMRELDIPEKVLRIASDKTPAGEHSGRYNAPTVSEVAVIMVGDPSNKRDIILSKHDGGLKTISELHPTYDALQYPLMLWNGQDGYHIQISQVPTRGATTTKTISCRAYYAYQLMIKNTQDENEKNPLLYFREVFQQYIVDMYAKIETERLNYIRFNQKALRSEQYIHLRDAMQNDNANPNDIGKKVVLPATFTGSPRHMQQYAQDALTCVRKFGRPDLFITFTCNPKWPEITELLYPGQDANDRHDIIARVFYQKVKLMIKLLTVGQVFGSTKGFMYCVEWQKRGNPHVHILLWLQDKLRPHDIDQIISAEIPSPVEDPKLFKSVVTNMIHGPCNSRCLVNNKCSKRYPRKFIAATQTDEDGYPLYRRRSPEDGGHAYINPNTNTVVDNRNVVPYSPLLMTIFDAHINVEYCQSVKSIKYLCKYVYKGSDKAVVEVSNNSERQTSVNAEENNDDEIKRYQVGRYISTNEAIWRILKFPIHDRDPTIVTLDVHLENGERVYFTSDTAERALNERRQTTLKAFFELCSTDNFAKSLLYSEIPTYYTWNNKAWKRRKQGEAVDGWPGIFKSNALGRVYSVHPSQQECFYLRLLLHHIKGPTSFNDLKEVGGNICGSFKEACIAHRLVENDDHLFATMQEAAETRSPSKIRELFVIILTNYYPATAEQLWQRYKADMSEDILFRLRNELGDPDLPFTNEIANEALIDIEDKVLVINGKRLSYYGIPNPERDMEQLCMEVLRETNYDKESLLRFVEQNRPLIDDNEEQSEAYEYLMTKLESDSGSITFIDAPGGTGKTFLLNLILAEVRSRGEIALATATSGIAATLLDGGRTAHSTFKIPLHYNNSSEIVMCNIEKNSGTAKLLRQCKVIIWDECTMANKRALESLNATLQDIRDNNQIMGGVCVILAGDFRQTLPIITRGTAADEIQACLKCSDLLWPIVKSIALKKNIRALLTGDDDAQQFSDYLLEIGDGRLETDDEGDVVFHESFCNYTEDFNELKSKLYPNIEDRCTMDESYYNWLRERAILAPTNEAVNKINSDILKDLNKPITSYKSFDKTLEEDDAARYTTEFLNSQDIPGMPQHNIELCVGAPIILLRNLNAPKLCNGTRLCVKSLSSNLIEAVVLSGCNKGSEVFIPRIPIIENDIPFPFKRTQFPIRLAFGMTINKSQGQSLGIVGVSLINPCFTHGQLYVACSRVGTGKNLYIMAPNNKTKNIVYQQVLSSN